MEIIGLMGDIGAGKSTVADLIESELYFDRNVRFVSFADTLKDIVASIHPEWERGALNGITSKDRAWREVPDPNSWCQKSPRDELRELSDMIKARYGSDYFVNRTLEEIFALRDLGYIDLVIITDVRYQIEIDALLSERIGAARLVWVDGGMEGYVSNHPSDVEWKFWVKNNLDRVIRVDNTEKNLDRLNSELVDKILTKF